MRNHISIFLLIMLLAMGGCKKDKCAGIVCQNGGTCVDGVCVCTNGYTGTHCDTLPPTYGITGNYLVATEHYSWTAFHNDDTSYFTYSDTLVVYRITDYTIKTNRSASFLLDYVISNDSTKSIFREPSQLPHLDYSATFFVNNPDSIYLHYSGGGMGSGSGINMYGHKIH